MSLKNRLPFLLLLLSIILTGCGTGASAQAVNGNSAAALANGSTSNGSAVARPAPVNIDTKSPAGRQELDQKVNQKLHNLDQALDALDKSLGKIQ